VTDRLRVEGIEKAFGSIRVLRNVTFSVSDGEAVGLFGPNGSGKTTVANIISGLIPPDRGRILLEGRDIGKLPMDARFRAGIARTFQIPDPYPSLSVMEAVRVALLCGEAAPRKGGASPESLDRETEAILRRTGLFPQRFLPAAGLSQGCLRRLEFARAVSCRPKLVILDEVFSALSAKDERELAALMRSLHREEGASILLISHNPLLLEEMCDRVVALEDGIVRWEGSAKDLARFVPAAHDHGDGPA
jgi:branched-chain amino acid transport system ATP-binding protein